MWTGGPQPAAQAAGVWFCVWYAEQTVSIARIPLQGAGFCPSVRPVGSGTVLLPLALSQCPMSTQAEVIPIVMQFCCRGSVRGSSPAWAKNNAETFRVCEKASCGFPLGLCLHPEAKLCVLCC